MFKLTAIGPFGLSIKNLRLMIDWRWFSRGCAGGYGGGKCNRVMVAMSFDSASVAVNRGQAGGATALGGQPVAVAVSETSTCSKSPASSSPSLSLIRRYALEYRNHLVVPSLHEVTTIGAR